MNTPLRLVVDRVGSPVVEFASNPGAPIHIHLHVGTAPSEGGVPSTEASTTTPVSVERMPRSNSTWKNIGMGASALVLLLVSYDLGARNADGHNQARERVPDPRVSAIQRLPPVSGELPEALRRQLAAPPSVEMPDANSPHNAPDPFGLQR